MHNTDFGLTALGVHLNEDNRVELKLEKLRPEDDADTCWTLTVIVAGTRLMNLFGTREQLCFDILTSSLDAQTVRTLQKPDYEWRIG